MLFRSMTELKVLDTYWSDHCRHTTFETILQNVKIEAGALQETIQKAYDTYVRLREEVHGGRKVMTLMDIATIGGKTLRKRGKLEDLEVSDETVSYTHLLFSVPSILSHHRS